MFRKPLLATWLAAAAITTAAVAPAGATLVPYSGSIVAYTVTQSGLYDLTAVGATGGVSYTGTGAAGASVSGELSLLADTILYLVVGGAGVKGDAGSFTSGGGGGSFIYLDAAHPLLVAGGGGGGTYSATGLAASVDPSGNGTTATVNSGVAGTGGSGGGAGPNLGFQTSAGGAGFFGDGQTSVTGAKGGNHTTFAGGDGLYGANGGFGGGGGGAGGGGGGGGYSGGAGSAYRSGPGGGGGGGGGGGSFAAADFAAVEFTQGVNTSGNGWIDISLIAAAALPNAVPEPASLALLSIGLGLLVLTSRRRRSSDRHERRRPDALAFSAC